MSETMKALVYRGPEKIGVEDVPMPKIIEPDDAIVRVTTSTICGTDIHIWHGGMPEVEPGRIIGHEFCGEVVEVGPAVRNVRWGTRYVPALPSAVNASTVFVAFTPIVLPAAGSLVI